MRGPTGGLTKTWGRVLAVVQAAGASNRTSRGSPRVSLKTRSPLDQPVELVRAGAALAQAPGAVEE
jgi:hypothetical protein